MSKESQETLKKKFSFRDRLFLVTAVYLIFITVWNLFDLNASLLITDIISIFITIFIWYSDGILKINLKYKYIIYYILVLISSLIIVPRNISEIFKILYRQGFREEVFFRLFFIGVFLIFYEGIYNNQQHFIYIILISNLIFASLHPHFITFFTGLAFTMIYIKGGIISCILAHTIFNAYLGNYIIKLLALLPSIFIFPSVNDLVNNITRFIYSKEKKNKLKENTFYNSV
jgi:hypothetical protein